MGVVAAILAAGSVLAVAKGSARRAPSVDRSIAAWRSAVVLGVVSVLVVGPGATVVVVGAGTLVGKVGSLRRRRKLRGQTALAVPDVVDLFRLAVGAGLSVPVALRVVAPRAPEAVRPSLVEADRRRRRGLPIADALDHLADGLGPDGVELVALLHQGATAGTPLAAPLADLAARRRSERWARTRSAAGRLSVTMLFPLVLCTLPAAIALAVVPLVAVSLDQLSA